MKKRLIIVGAGAMGRECCQYAQATLPGYSVVGFLDSRSGILDGYGGYPPILGSVENYQAGQNDHFVCSIGEVEPKMRYVNLLKSKGARFVSVVHPLAYVGQNVKIGNGCIIAPGVVLTADLALGDHVIVNVQSSISHDCHIGDGSTISPGCHIAGWCRLGKRVFLGVHSTLIPHIVLGDDVYVAAGAVVVKAVECGRVMGIPAVPK